MNKTKKTIKVGGDNLITLCITALLLFGTLMIASAEMGSQAGNIKATGMVLFKQIVYVVLGFAAMKFCSRFDFLAFKKSVFNTGALVACGLLLACLAFPSTNGANAWIYIGPFSIQPAEFIKVYSLMYLAKFFSVGYRNRDEEKLNFIRVGIMILLWVLIILVFQRDTGSCAVLVVMSYIGFIINLRPSIAKLQNGMFYFMMFVGVFGAFFLVSPFFINFLASLDTDYYAVSRFIAFANPFKYKYDIGYHLVMSLVSLANGGLIGTGFGSSIHKYMNFPNQSNDFILSIIVEELGFVGFLGIIIPYTIIVVRLARYALSKYADARTRIILIGTIMMLLSHFIFNVGGISGFIPLTGVPLLLVSSGGSSTVAFLIAIGLCQYEIKRINRKKAEERCA